MGLYMSTQTIRLTQSQLVLGYQLEVFAELVRFFWYMNLSISRFYLNTKFGWFQNIRPIIEVLLLLEN